MAPRITVALVLLVVAMLALHGCPKPVEKAPEVTSPKLEATQPPPTEGASNAEAGPANETEASANSEAAPEAAGDAKVLFETKCSKCHEIAKATKEPGDKAHWDGLVKEMAAKKAGWISDAEIAQIAEYCCATYPK
jgi:mono/diheme cytochrome c family protein